jgi:hypothetical protein
MEAAAAATVVSRVADIATGSSPPSTIVSWRPLKGCESGPLAVYSRTHLLVISRSYRSSGPLLVIRNKEGWKIIKNHQDVPHC